MKRTYKSIGAAIIFSTWEWTDYPAGKNFTLSYRAGLHTGTLVPDSEAAEELGRLGDTTGRFTKGTLDLTAVQGLGRDFDMLLKLSGKKRAAIWTAPNVSTWAAPTA